MLTAAAARRPLQSAAVLGLGHALPARALHTAEIAARLGIAEDWIVRRTGIHERRIVDGETVADLAVRAGRAALEDAGIEAADIDLVLLATLTPDQVCPSGAPLVAHRLGAVRAGAMDIGAACTGFVSALSVATAQVETGRAERVLVIGAEVLTRFVDFDDRRTAGLFGDGAGAMVVGPGDAAIGPVVLHHDGSLTGAIFAAHDEHVLRMEGHDTFVAAVAAMADCSLEACAAAGIAVEDVDVVVLHQANQRILTAVAQRLGLPERLMIDYIGRTGNTSAASIPLALSLAREDNRLRAGERMLIAAAGAGFTSGALVLEWGLS